MTLETERIKRSNLDVYDDDNDDDDNDDDDDDDDDIYSYFCLY